MLDFQRIQNSIEDQKIFLEKEYFKQQKDNIEYLKQQKDNIGEFDNKS